jgi:CDP-diacylglycerol--serine O-phosphatidyltransferase
MKQIPNFFTLLNLIFGCIAIVFIMQTGETIVLMDDGGATQVLLPEKITWGALCIFAAAIVDFLDGFLARLLKASSGMGEQLDSLSDMVSFGVAPGMILYQLLRRSFAQEDYGLDVSLIALLPAFIFTAAVAWRLAKFNISTTQTFHFEGVPSPAAGLVVASFPLIIWHQCFNLQDAFINRWVLYGSIIVLAYLMVCSLPFLAVKFKDYSLRNNLTKYILLGIAALSAVFLQWLAVPLVFIIYIIISLTSKPSDKTTTPSKEITDITV